MLQETEQRRLSDVKSMQNIIDSIIYVMYTRENFEYCWGSWFGSYSEYNLLYSIFTNAIKQARRIQRDDCGEVYDEDGCNDAGPRTVGLRCFNPVQRLNKWSKASNFLLKRKFPLKMSVMTPSTASAVLKNNVQEK
jgi:hypothetical protein